MTTRLMVVTGLLTGAGIAASLYLDLVAALCVFGAMLAGACIGWAKLLRGATVRAPRQRAHVAAAVLQAADQDPIFSALHSGDMANRRWSAVTH